MTDMDSRDLPGRLGVAVQMLAHAGKTGGPAELTPTRLTALAVMNAAGPMRMGNLASRLGIQVSTMSRIVDVLVSSGWAERRPDEADHRACVIGITDQGVDLINSVRCMRETRLADCIADLDPADLTALEAALPVLEELARRVTDSVHAAAPAYVKLPPPLPRCARKVTSAPTPAAHAKLPPRLPHCARKVTFAGAIAPAMVTSRSLEGEGEGEGAGGGAVV